MKSITLNKKSPLLVLSVIAILMVLFFAVFLQEMRSFLLLEEKNALKEIAQQCAVAVKNKLDSRLEVLSSLANLKEVSSNAISDQDKQDLLRQEVNRSRFIRIGLSDLQGNVLTTDGQTFNIGDRFYFQQAKQGLSSISEKLRDRAVPQQNLSIIIYAAPIRNTDHEIIGVIFATDHAAQLTALIENVYVGPKKKTMLLTNDGKILAESPLNATAQNFFELTQPATDPSDFAHIRQILNDNTTGAGTFQAENTKKIIGIANIEGIADWNIAVTAPENMVMLQAAQMMWRVIALIVVLILCACASFCYFYRLNKKYNQEKQNTKLAEIQLQLKDQFIANVSHEIRTPMNAITGMVYFLKSTAPSDLQRTYLKKIETASEVLLGIINDILDMSKISNGKLNLHIQPFALAAAIQTIDDIFSTKIREKNLRWEIDCDDFTDIWLHGDKQRLIQIIINLVNNAYKFTEQGAITLRIHAATDTETSVQYIFSVQDTGIGIAEPDIKKLFMPFEQLEGSRNKVYEGTGLGLCICQNLLHAMGGGLSVQSEKGRGSTFSFRVTFPKAPMPPPEAASPPANIPIAHAGSILLVEDNGINAEIAGFLLDELNLPYDWVDNGQKAVDKCRTAHYSLILMDIHMPVLNGYEAAKILKENLHITCPIIALTATNLNHDALTEEKIYIDGYISKPFDAEHFKQELRRHLSP